MKHRKILTLCLALALVLQLLCGCAGQGRLRVLDRSGDPIPTSQATYLKLAQKEAAGIIAEAEGISLKKAERLLRRGRYTVNTAYDPAVYAALEEAYKADGMPKELGCAVTDTSGQLLALFSVSETKTDRATAAAKPYGALAPLSVYAPAIESGKAHYSSLYLDAALLKVQDENWPVNPNGSYTNKKTTLAAGVGQGLSTVAVRCLKEYGTDEAAAYPEKYGISLNPESNSEESLLATLATGEQGVALSPLDLAGHYTVFANGGSYTAPYTVLQITDEQNAPIYEGQPEAQQLLQEGAAYIVNRMLTAATAEGGIAQKAAWGKIPVAGMAATGAEGSWFVGLTPQYSCAVWHNASEENHAPAFFAEALSKLKHSESADFIGSPDVRKAAFCKESGLLYGKGCSKMQTGYYTNEALPTTCQNH